MLKTTIVEPQKARFTNDNAIVKDHFYYNSNEFSWNKPAKINDKYYPFFHKQKDENKGKVEFLQAQEQQDKVDFEEYRKQRILDMKQKTKASYDQRVLERSLIQSKSSQPIKSLPTLGDCDLEEKALDVIARRIDASKHTRTNDISWNHLHRASKKYVDQHLRPICVQREDELIENFKKKLAEERAKDQEVIERRSEKHKSIRETFLAKHQQNQASHSRIGQAPDFEQELNAKLDLERYSSNIPNSIQNLDIIDQRRDSLIKPSSVVPSMQSMEGGMKYKYPRNLPQIDNTKRKVTITPVLEKLAEPRKMTPKPDSLEYAELKGLLIKNMDDKVYYSGNQFYEALAGYSNNFQNTLKENRDSRKKLSTQGTSRDGRFSSSSKRTLTLNYTSAGPVKIGSQTVKLSENKKITIPAERNEIYNELDLFERRMPVTKPTGYARTDLTNPAILMAAQKSHF